MKTKTFKALLLFVILMQLGSAGLVFAQIQSETSGSSERALLNKLNKDLNTYHVTLIDSELTFAQNSHIDDTAELDSIKTVIKDDLDKLSAMSTGERKEVYEKQVKLFNAAGELVEQLKQSTNATGDKFALLVVLLAGMRRMSKILHKMDDDIAHLYATLPAEGEHNNLLPIAAVVLCLLSAGTAGFLFYKGQPAY